MTQPHAQVEVVENLLLDRRAAARLIYQQFDARLHGATTMRGAIAGVQAVA